MGADQSSFEPPPPNRRISSGSSAHIETLIPHEPTSEAVRLVVSGGSSLSGEVNAPWLNLEFWVNTGSKIKFKGKVNNIRIMYLNGGSAVDLGKVEYGRLLVEGDVMGGSSLTPGKVVKRSPDQIVGPPGGTGWASLPPPAPAASSAPVNNAQSASSSQIPLGAPPQYEDSGPSQFTSDRKDKY
ncbi:hypothetical protein HDV00_003101 [Rhizophlyctis rosea]|nr:hypothetical protein HDV00_003101 [Rhizophlyctis rosea]